MSWDCDRHEVNSGSAKWKDKVARIPRNHPSDGVARQSVCPFCCEELILAARRVHEAFTALSIAMRRASKDFNDAITLFKGMAAIMEELAPLFAHLEGKDIDDCNHNTHLGQ